jgi:cytochrome b
MDIKQELQRELFFSKTIRVYHFLFALFIVLAYISSGSDLFLLPHSIFGAIVLLVVFLRLIWFIAGEKGAKLNSFDLNFSSLKSYTLHYFNFKDTKPRNPAASFAAITMWILAIVSVVSGFIFIGAKYGSGLFGGLYSSDFDIHTIKEIHELASNFLMFVAGIHVVGVIVENFIKKTNIAKTMFDGKLHSDVKLEQPNQIHNSIILSGTMGILIIGFGMYIFINPKMPLFDSSANYINYKLVAPTMTQECTECHMFYPPNLTNQKTQLEILKNLPNHYGTDASLDDATLVTITQETMNLAPIESRFRFDKETFLTNNQSITNTERWKHDHEELGENWFKENKIKKTSCKECHTGIENGSITPYELNKYSRLLW